MIAVIFSASLSGAHDINTGEQHLKCEIIYEEIFFFFIEKMELTCRCAKSIKDR